MDSAWRIVGALNRRRAWLRTILFCYAAESEYTRRYCYSWAVRWLRPRATPIGVYRQDGRWGLILASPATEAELLRRGNPTLEALLAQLARIAAFAGVRDIRVTGALASHLKRMHHPLVTSDAGEIVAGAVLSAAIEAARSVAMDWDAPVVVMAGRGAIGPSIAERLRGLDRSFVAIGAAHVNATTLPALPSLVVDVSGFEVLALYAERLRPGSVVVTDVLHEPPPRTVKRLKERGVRVFHVAGVKGTVSPGLPGVYSQTIPLCALLGFSESTSIVMKEV
jgi:hypothetical protein